MRRDPAMQLDSNTNLGSAAELAEALKRLRERRDALDDAIRILEKIAISWYPDLHKRRPRPR
jgi:hypothetical protein